ncbi:PLP-dependent transferase [candidate division KSB1 bacterium]|nr:PLP-dependent transferase [candidate division KSB1 bacterium]
MKLETLLIHAGAEIDRATGSVSPPINLSTTFEHGPEAERLYGYMYIRESNPTQTRLETALAAVEGGEAALVFASGIAAGAAYLQALPAGSHVIFHRDIYYDFRTVANEFMPKWGSAATLLDMKNLDEVRAAMRPNTRLLWAETPTNPLMQILDVAALAKTAHDAGAKLIVDATFATPVLQRTLELGADVALHSMTKYLGGHSDVQGGALIFRKREHDFDEILHIRKVLGAVLSPFNSWLVLRGLRSLACRVERHSANAMALAHFLEQHSGVEQVHYPGLPSHSGHEIAGRQMRAFGGMLSFQVKGGREQAVKVVSRVKLFTTATSLGGTESLIEHRASSEGPSTTTPDNLLRVSTGLEDPEDLIQDLSQALA